MGDIRDLKHLHNQDEIAGLVKQPADRIKDWNLDLSGGKLILHVDLPGGDTIETEMGCSSGG